MIHIVFIKILKKENLMEFIWLILTGLLLNFSTKLVINKNNKDLK